MQKTLFWIFSFTLQMICKVLPVNLSDVGGDVVFRVHSESSTYQSVLLSMDPYHCEWNPMQQNTKLAENTKKYRKVKGSSNSLIF